MTSSGRARHICFLSSSAPLGPGSSYSSFVLNLAECLVDRGYHVTILAPHVMGSRTREVLQGVTIRRFRYLPMRSAETLGLHGGMLPSLKMWPLNALKVPLLVWGQFRALKSLHAENPVDLVHSHWLIPQSVVAGWFTRSGRLPHVATAHGSDVLGLNLPGMRAILGYAAKNSDLITVNSCELERELRRRIGRREIRIIPIGARIPDPSSIAGNLELRKSLTDGSHLVGFVGRVIPEKGIFQFVRLIAELRVRAVDVRGLIVGGGSAEADAQALARELGVHAAVQFTGAVDPERVPLYMSVADTLVVPSHYEAQGLVAIEAMLMGLPVVAFEVGGLREIVVDGETGITVPAGDVGALTAAVERLIETPELRTRLALRAREKAESKFTLETAADRFDEEYQRLFTDPTMTCSTSA